MLDSAMSSLHIRLPGEPLTTAKTITAFPPKNTKNDTTTIQKSTPTYSVETNTNYVGSLNGLLNSESSVAKVSPVELCISGGQIEKIEIHNKDLSNEQINDNSDNNELVNNSENEIKQENSKVHNSDIKSKLKLIDDILGFDAEKDKLDFFKGQLNENISNITNRNVEFSANIGTDNKTDINITSNRNISENEIKDLYREYKNAKSPSNLLDSNPNYNANKKYPDGKYDPNSLLQNSAEINKSQNKKMKVVFARQLNTFSDSEINSNSNNNSMNNFSVQSTQPSAPPQQQSQNQTQNTSSFIPSSFLLSNSNFSNTSDNRLQNENRTNQISGDKISRDSARYLSSSDGEFKFEMGRITDIDSNPSFSPSTFPADGAAIRALRNAGIEKKKQEKIMIEEREKNREKEKERTNANKKEKIQNMKNNPNLFSFDSDKENGFLNINFSVKPLPAACSPVHDRMDYLNNMKKMRQQLIL